MMLEMFASEAYEIHADEFIDLDTPEQLFKYKFKD